MTSAGSSHSVPVSAPVKSSDARLGPLFEVLHDAVLLVRLADRRVVDANPAALRLFGYAREEIVGDTTRKLHPDEEHFARFGALAQGVPASGGSVVLDVRLRRKDGTLFPSQVTVSHVGHSPQEGTVVLGVIRDTTSETKRREREAFLSEAGKLLLRKTLQPDETLRAIAQLATTRLSDYASVNLIDPATGRIARVAIAHADPTKSHLVEDYAARFPPQPHLAEAMRKLAPGEAIVMNGLDLETLRPYASRPGEMELLAQVGLKHSLTVPLSGRRGILGSIGFTRTAGEPFSDDDVAVAKELASRAALAYENASLHQEAVLLEARWRSLVENASDWICLADAAGRILTINRGDGTSDPGDAEGRTLYEWLSPAEAEKFRAVYERVFAEAKPATITTTAVVKDATGHYESRIAPVINEGRVVAATVVTSDVTERIRTQEKLRATTANLQDFVETSAIGLHWVGPDGTILWANPADHEFLGYAKEEYVGQDIRRFHADRLVIEDILRRLARDERLHEYPARLVAKDGSIRHVLIDSSVYWKDGQFVHTRCFTRDVTAQVHAEARSKAAEDRLRRILQTAPAQVVTIDATGRILTINRSLRGTDPAKAVGLNVYDTVTPEDRERVRELIEGVMRTGEPAEYETRGLLGPGWSRWFHVRVGALENDDGRGAVLVTTDIEERKRTEEEVARMRAQLIQGEKLAALGSLVSGVAHELRTPLTYLSNSTFLLETRLQNAAMTEAPAKDAIASVRPFLKEIRDGVERINLLVEDLRKHTKARQEARLVEEPLNSLVGEAVELFVATARGSHVLQAALGPTMDVRANKGALQQVALNLLQNAAEASAPGTTIRIVTRQAGDRAILEITDEGAGIPESVRQRMFDPLFTTKAEGTGLGLSIVKRIADDHRATIECETRLGEGTTFRVSFPPIERADAP